MPHERIAQHISPARIRKNFSEDGLVELKRGAITPQDKNQPKLLEIM